MWFVSFCLVKEYVYVFFDVKKCFLENLFWLIIIRNIKEDYNVFYGVVGVGIYVDLDC